MAQQQKVKIAVPLEGGKRWVGEYDPEEKIQKLVEDFKSQTKTEIPEHIMMKWKKGNQILNLNDPVKTLLPKRAPTINLEYDYEQKGIDLPNLISNSPYLIGKPFYNPFEIEVFNKNNGNLQKLNLNPNDVKNTEIENYNPYSAYCNGNNHLYISGGQNEKNVTLGQFWDIDLEKETIEKLPEGINPKKNHSMIFIPDKYVFIVGGNDKKTFYYDTENKEIVYWANLNHERIEPALVVARNELYCFDNLKIDNNTLTFEKSILDKTPKWDLITPKIDPSIPDSSFNQKFFGAVKIDNDNIIFLGGDMIESKYSDMNYSYKIPDETIYKSVVPFKQKNLSEKSFVDIDNKNKLILPNYNKNSPELLLFNKEKFNLHSINFQIDKPVEKIFRAPPRKKINYSFDYNMPVRVKLDDKKDEKFEEKQLEKIPEKMEVKETDVDINKKSIDLEIKEKPIELNKEPINLKINKKPVELNNIEEKDMVKSIKNENEEPNNNLDSKINLQNKNSNLNKNIPNQIEETEYYFDPINKKKKEKPKNVVQSEIQTIHRNYDGHLLRSSVISGNKQVGIKSSNLPKIGGKNSPIKKSKIGVAGDFDSKKVNIHQSVNVGISGKKSGAKIISQ